MSQPSGVGGEEHVVYLPSARNPHQRIDIDPAPTAQMGTAQSCTAENRPRLPVITFRVLVIGRANAGKTSILQRVCETTESPTIYRGGEKVRDPTFCLQVRSYCRQVVLTPTMDVSNRGDSRCRWLPVNMKLARRAQDR